jgi:hypothetical protein
MSVCQLSDRFQCANLECVHTVKATLPSSYVLFPIRTSNDSATRTEQTERQIGRQADRQAGRQTGRQADIQLGRQADGQGRQAGRQTDMHAGRQIDVYAHVCTRTLARTITQCTHFHFFYMYTRTPMIFLVCFFFVSLSCFYLFFLNKSYACTCT